MKINAPNLNTVVEIPDSVLFRQDEKGQVHLINIDVDAMYSLSDLSAKVFLNFNGKSNLDQITKKISKKENAPLKRLQADTLDLVKSLLREKLIATA